MGVRITKDDIADVVNYKLLMWGFLFIVVTFNIKSEYIWEPLNFIYFRDSNLSSTPTCVALEGLVLNSSL